MVVVAIVGLIAGISFPAASAGLDSIRLKSAAQSVAGFLNAGVTHAERRQEPVELVIVQRQSLLELYSNEPGFKRELELPKGVSIESVLPEADDPLSPARSIVLMPGSAAPAIGIQLANGHGSRRIVRLDPMTGYPRVENVP
jgi:type II secretory pathway pseudopilin PulG